MLIQTILKVFYANKKANSNPKKYFDLQDLDSRETPYRQLKSSPLRRMGGSEDPCTSRCQFHQHFTQAFFTIVLAPKNFKPKMQLWNFWCQNIGTNFWSKMLMKLTQVWEDVAETKPLSTSQAVVEVIR